MSHDMKKTTKWVCAQRRLSSAWASALSYPLSAQRRLWSDWADQTGRMPRLRLLSLRSHSHFVGFVVAHITCIWHTIKNDLCILVDHVIKHLFCWNPVSVLFFPSWLLLACLLLWLEATWCSGCPAGLTLQGSLVRSCGLSNESINQGLVSTT